MKKTITFIVIVSVIMCILTSPSFAAMGDILGYAKYTDISAFINNYPIKSYNINDYTAIVVEDLRNYGFEVVWNEDSRTLTVGINNSADINGMTDIYKYSRRSGKNSFAYVETDIITNLNGKPVTSFNIGGQTCIYMDDLGMFGSVEWFPEIRAIKLSIPQLPTKEYEPLEEAPGITMYAPDGRTQVVDESDVKANESVGWYTYPVTKILAAGGQTKVVPVDIPSYKAYKEMLTKSINGIMDDGDYYQMFTEKIVPNASVGRTLYAYLLDITGDGKEELFLKESINHRSGAPLDGSSCEWIRVLSYTPDGLKRIGQTRRWAKGSPSDYGGNSYSFYKPIGFIGDIESSYKYPDVSDDYLYYCIGNDGKPYLTDYMPQYEYEENTMTFYAFNGLYLEEVCIIESSFVHDWYINKYINSDRGSYLYRVNREYVSEAVYRQHLNKYTGGGVYKLANNDYNEVLYKLSSACN